MLGAQSFVSLLILVLLLIPTTTSGQRVVNVGIDFPQDPGECSENGYNNPPGQIRIMTLSDRLTYASNFSVTVSLYSNPRAIPSTLTPKIIGKTEYTTEDGTVTFDQTGVDTLGWGFHYRYQVTASIEDTTITWDKYSAAFIVAANISDTTTTATPPPTTNPAAALQPVVGFPRDAMNCQPFGGQPGIRLMNLTNGGLTSATPFSVNTTLLSPTSPSTGDLVVSELTGETQLSSENGTATYSNLGVCGNPGIGYHLQHEVSFLDRTVTMIGAAFAVQGTDQPITTTATPAPPGVTTTTTTTSAPGTPTTTPGATCDLTMARVLFTKQPVGGNAGSVFATQPIIQIIDARTSLLLNGCSGTATAEVVWPSYFGTSWGATLQGSPTVTTTNGVFNFQDLAISKAGYGYHLKVTVTASDRTFTVYSAVIYVGSAGGNIVDESDLIAAGPEGGVQQIPDSNEENGRGGAAANTERSKSESSTTTERSLIIVNGIIAVVAMIVPLVVFGLTRSYYKKQIDALQQNSQLPSRPNHHHQGRYSAVPLGDSSGSIILPALDDSVEEDMGSPCSSRKGSSSVVVPLHLKQKKNGDSSQRSNPVLNYFLQSYSGNQESSSTTPTDEEVGAEGVGTEMETSGSAGGVGLDADTHDEERCPYATPADDTA